MLVCFYLLVWVGEWVGKEIMHKSGMLVVVQLQLSLEDSMSGGTGSIGSIGFISLQTSDLDLAIEATCQALANSS